MEQPIEILINGAQMRKLYEKQAEPLRRQYQLRKIDMELLYYLSKAGREHNTAKDLNQLKLFTKGHISQSISRMRQQNLVKVLQDKEDRRYGHIILTEAAKELVAEIEKLHVRIQEIVFQGITREEINSLIEIAIKMNKNIEKELRNGI
ncbi:MAG: MarR family winged helix-turn-helix transcriptional regulator [Lachnospiraceae bacterium]|nr:MarR family winged helix-turn-helix transcriptional regulator [Lachnospiraceae bacterium]